MSYKTVKKKIVSIICAKVSETFVPQLPTGKKKTIALAGLAGLVGMGSALLLIPHRR